MRLDAKTPSGPLAEKWDRHLFELKLVNPANKRKYDIIVVGTGLAGGSASPNTTGTPARKTPAFSAPIASRSGPSQS